jgi:predicted aspartyl protease
VGEVRLIIEIGDVQEERFEPAEVLVDTGATYSQVPGSLLRRLGIPVKWEAQVRLGDGSIVTDQIGQASIRLEGKTFMTPVTFGRDGEPNLLGLVALETALLAVDPVDQRQVPTIGWKA